MTTASWSSMDLTSKRLQPPAVLAPTALPDTRRRARLPVTSAGSLTRTYSGPDGSRIHQYFEQACLLPRAANRDGSRSDPEQPCGLGQSVHRPCCFAGCRSRTERRRDRFKPMASCVSALASMVANGHQVCPMFPPPPSYHSLITKSLRGVQAGATSARRP
jgi:hypothetical protein